MRERKFPLGQRYEKCMGVNVPKFEMETAMSDEIKKVEDEAPKAEATPALSEQQLDEVVGGSKAATKNAGVQYLEFKIKQI